MFKKVELMRVSKRWRYSEWPLDGAAVLCINNYTKSRFQYFNIHEEAAYSIYYILYTILHVVLTGGLWH